MKNGGPAIRYRTATELLGKSGSVNIDQLSHDLIHSRIVGLWLERLVPSNQLNQIHSSMATAYENAMGKLVQMGCHNGITQFDEKTEYYRKWMQSLKGSSEFPLNPFMQMVVGSFLVAAGYHQEKALIEYLEQRLDTLWNFTQEMNYDIYADRDDYPDIPKGFGDKPLVKPEFYIDGEERFPTIYDIHGLAKYPDHLKSQDTQQKINTVIDYTLDPRYQEFPDGYGLMKAGKRKYYAIGWSVHLPGYHPEITNRFDDSRFIQRLVLMSHFPTARDHHWFQDSLKHLESYRTKQGTYSFPRSYLQERPSGYWVMGAYMGLEENRRKKIAIEMESTFWMLKIKLNNDRTFSR